ncbi:MAG: indole-3-glycerol phosphate synthase TrpC [Bacillota bacterium]
MILDKILAHKREEVEELKKSFSPASLNNLISGLPPVRSMALSLKKTGGISLIAEIKKASPSKGVIRENFNPPEIAGIYTKSGADAISVLTDSKFFDGRPEYITAVRRVSPLPILRKDFIIDPVQIYQARALGADAVLLIVAALNGGELASLLSIAGESGLEAIVEVHDEGQLERAVGAGAAIIGINNRDLNTFKTDLRTTLRLCGMLKGSGKVIVSESGINTRQDMEMLREAGVDAVLVGESLMRAPDIASKVKELTGRQ